MRNAASRVYARNPLVVSGTFVLDTCRTTQLPIRWSTEIVDWRPQRTFTDRQLSGPYPLLEHTHRLSPLSGGAEIFDFVRYRLHGGPLAPLVRRIAVGRWLDEIFDYRAARMRYLLG